MTQGPLCGPLDALHAECLAARTAVREWFAQARTAVAEWTPAPLDPLPVERKRPLTRQQQAWFDAYEKPDLSVWEADDPLLRPPRPWFRK